MKKMMRNAIEYLCRQKGRDSPLSSWFADWLKKTKELHVIKSKLITHYYVEIYTERDLEEWFTTKYVFVLKETSIADLSSHEATARIHNIDKKGARLVYLGG